MRMNSLLIVLFAIILGGTITNPAWADHAERIRAAGVLRIATNPGIEPMAYLKNGDLVGYDIDLGNRLAERIGVRAEWVVYEDLEDLVEIVKAGASGSTFDIVISAMGIDDTRTQRSIAVPYFKSGLTILTTTSEAVNETLDDLTGKRIAAVKGSTEHHIISRMGKVTVVAAANYGEIQDHLAAGRAQAAVLDVPVALLAVKRDPDALRVSEMPFEEEWYGIYMDNEEKHLFRNIRIAIQDMRRNGTLEQLRATWF